MPQKISSPIPSAAVERVIQRHDNGVSQQSEFVAANGGVVGGRLYDDAGFALCEWGEQDGHLHGLMLEWLERGVLCSAIPFRAGVEHGTARQWSRDGRLIGQYTMKAGSGWDLWWEESVENGAPFLSEARRFESGLRQGYEWWISPDQRSVQVETSYRQNVEHGIRREWAETGELKSGFPRFLVNGKKVARKAYDAAARSDATLPPYSAADDRPERKFPAEVSAALGKPQANPIAKPKQKPIAKAKAKPRAKPRAKSKAKPRAKANAARKSRVKPAPAARKRKTPARKQKSAVRKPR